MNDFYPPSEQAKFDRLMKRLAKIENPDMVPLMVSWVDIIRTDNREGVLAGTDKDGKPMYPVTYRPKGDVAKLTAGQRRGMRGNQKRDLLFGGFGPHASGLNNNLTTKEYQRLDGPPLAPRRQFSRVITNLLIGYWEEGQGKASVWGFWDEVVSTKGYNFLHDHFTGLKLRNGRRLPPRDLRGVRPEGKLKAREAARAWALDLIRSTGV